jgi:hypothetical protein
MYTYIYTYRNSPTKGHPQRANERLMGQKQDGTQGSKTRIISGARDKIIIHIGSRPTACRFTRHAWNNWKQTHQTQIEGSKRFKAGSTPKALVKKHSYMKDESRRTSFWFINSAILLPTWEKPPTSPGSPLPPCWSNKGRCLSRTDSYASQSNTSIYDTHLQHNVMSSAHTGEETWAIHDAAATYRTPLSSHGSPIEIAPEQANATFWDSPTSGNC